MSTWQIAPWVAWVATSPARVTLTRLDTRDAAPLALLDSAATIWSALAGPEETSRPTRSTAEIVADVADRYGADVGAVEADVTAFLDQLLTAGLVISG